MNLSGNLFVVCCSNHKDEGGHDYKPVHCAYDLIPDLKKDFFETRNRALESLILNDEVYDRFRKRLNLKPYNKYIREGPDFGGKAIGKYLPAYQRYQGRFFKEIRSKTWEHLKDNVVIISGLYGILLPYEPIQLYSLDISVSPQHKTLWQDKDFLTDFFVKIIELKKVKKIWILIGDTNYSKLIKWDKVRNVAQVYFAAGEQNHAGPDLLPSLGNFLQQYFGERKSPLTEEIEENEWYPTRYEQIMFVKENPYVDPPDRKEKEEGLKKQFFKSINLSLNVLKQVRELNKEIQIKFIKCLDKFLNSPGSVDFKQVKSAHGIWRMDIDDYYRIHIKIDGDVAIIDEVGTRNIGGIK